MWQAGTQLQQPYLFHLYYIRLALNSVCVSPVMLHRGGEQRGADGLAVITARDEKERKGDNERWGGRRRTEGRRVSQMGDKK